MNREMHRHHPGDSDSNALVRLRQPVTLSTNHHGSLWLVIPIVILPE